MNKTDFENQLFDQEQTIKELEHAKADLEQRFQEENSALKVYNPLIIKDLG
jgi:hypothetical protein